MEDIQMNEFSPIAAALVGLLGGVHCLAMCGGIVGALTLSLKSEQQGRAASLPYLLSYNLGRISSYTAAGAIAGGIGVMLAGIVSLQYAQQVLLLLAALFMLAMGLYLGGWWMGLTRIERLGGHAWRHIEPMGRKLLPVRSLKQAFLLGLLWGWLPCGLVYSVLIWATTAGSALNGALLMFSFALGTLPNLLLMGTAANWLSAHTRKPVIRRLAGGLVICFGLYMLYGLLVQ